ncbi:MAG: ImmA/IrrE family metallo-endopeptidase [Candidatus Beckwithbacteria bacterium]|nr:ImmA/IrrE family metallo-endopeptidase [Candidatus Beckwithbacteria bacterium]
MNFQDEPNDNGFALKLARNLIKQSVQKIPPIRLNLILKQVDFKISVQGKDLGDEDGFSVGTTQIIYNNKKPETRIRYTIAHELGHILMGHNSGFRTIDFSNKNPDEVAANKFAAELLVPLQLIKAERLISLSWSELAKNYWVSKDMMMWRLKETKLYDKLANWN